MVRKLFGFPDPVNETSARVVAAGVVVQAVALLAFRSGWVLVPLTFGFAARVLTGPTLSPLGQLATRIVTPRLNVAHRYVPGPPKRFAQGIGLAFTGGASIAWLAGAPIVSYVLIGLLLVAATLESVLGLCLGCVVYRFFWECAECNDITERMQRALAVQQAGQQAAPRVPATR